MRAWDTKDADLETFQMLDAPTRSLILRMLDEPTDDDHAALGSHPRAAMIASWLLTLPPYRNINGYEDDQNFLRGAR
ncbi:hypothetical protein DE4585_00347 [Mycobacteroides salmoniphilum]|uniref:Uncharacterized protein n=1 Tax=Mycobacteroides salmoniphilum TaxID=404941 RepID=A0A4R8S8G7_9MYCO|nr:hypothetical protein [Mycobacteroides salmoniphilum]TDZ87355.1 hypothetical protein DE4585_00347 [Mycobacteroides salmoniphilum]